MKKLFNSKRFMSLALTLLMIVSSIAWDGLTVEAAITYGDNLIQNGDFETVDDDGKFVNWEGTYTEAPSVIYAGNHSVYINKANPNISQIVTLDKKGEKKYELTGYIRLEAGRSYIDISHYSNEDTTQATKTQTLTFGLSANGYSSSPDFSFTDQDENVIPSNELKGGQWYKFSCDIGVAETTTHLKVTFRQKNATYYDNLELREKIEVATDTGLVPNGDFETAGTGEGNDVFADWTETVADEINELKVDGYTGSAVQVSSSNTVEQVLAVETGKTYELTGYINMKGARAYTYINGTRLHFDLRAASEMTPHIIFENASGNPVDAPVANGGWFKFSYLVTATADTMNLKLEGKSGLTLFDDVSLHEATDVINVTEIALDKNELTLQEGFEATLSATFAPADAKYQTVAWTSNNSDVATVDRNGKVTAVAAGTATITATSNNGISATCTVTVTPPFDGVLIENGGFEILTEDGFFEGWTAVVPENALIIDQETSTETYPRVKEGKYSLCIKLCELNDSSKGAIQVVDVEPGTTYELSGYLFATGRAYLGWQGYSDAEAMNGIGDYANKPFRGGYSVDEGIKIYDNRGNELNPTEFRSGEWIKFVCEITTSEETEYLKIGLGSYKSTWTVYDNVALRKVDTPVESVSLDKEELALTVGGEVTLTATVAPNNATDKTITWTTNADNVATVDENGKVTAVAEGTAIITATSNNGISANCTVTVIDPEFTVNGAPVDGTLLDAIAAAEAGSVIKLRKDVTIEADIVPSTAITLDLNGKTLTASSFVAFKGTKVIDSVGGGLLKVGFCSLDESNAQTSMPVYNGADGYVFTDIVHQQQRNSELGASTFELVFRPSLGAGAAAKNTLLANGGDAAKICIGIRLDWTIPASGEFNATGYGATGNAVQVSQLNYTEQTIAVEVGQTYELTGYINMEGARAYAYINSKALHFDLRDGKNCPAGMTFEDADGNPVDKPVSKGGWYKFSYPVTADSDSINLKLIGQSGATYFDNISLCKAGDATNLVVNGDFETAGTGEDDDIFAGWTETRGNVAQTKTLVYEDDMVKEVYSLKKAFYIKALGADKFDNLKITPVVQSQMNEKIVWDGDAVAAK